MDAGLCDIRLARRAEVVPLLSVQLMAYRQGTWPSCRVGSGPDAVQAIARDVDAQTAWVVVMDNALIGAARCVIQDDLALLYRLAIHPLHQHRGLGSRLFCEVTQQLASRGVSWTAWVTPSVIPMPEACNVGELWDPAIELPPGWVVRAQGPAHLTLSSSAQARIETFLCDTTWFWSPIPVRSPEPTWERIGSCRRSGHCCTRIFLGRDGRTLSGEAARALSEAELAAFNSFTATAGVTFEGEMPDGTAVFRCKQLSFSTEGLAICYLFDQPDRRPPVCGAFPVSAAAYRYLDCGFSFSEKHDGESK